MTEDPKQNKHLPHLPQGNAVMVDISHKPTSKRTAVATGKLTLNKDAMACYLDQTNKGNARTTAQVAGIMAAKRTSDLIPLCHPLPLSNINIDIDQLTPTQLKISATVSTNSKTGVEMEALTAVSVTCLTLYDMLKAIDKSMLIASIQLESKTK